MPVKSSVSDTTFWSITLGVLLITIAEAKAKALRQIYSTGINHDIPHKMIIICL